jgi:hypothetical protein
LRIGFDVVIVSLGDRTNAGIGLRALPRCVDIVISSTLPSPALSALRLVAVQREPAVMMISCVRAVIVGKPPWSSAPGGRRRAASPRHRAARVSPARCGKPTADEHGGPRIRSSPSPPILTSTPGTACLTSAFTTKRARGDLSYHTIAFAAFRRAEQNVRA